MQGSQRLAQGIPNNLSYRTQPVSTKKETALDVFIKMNPSAAALSTYDTVVAQVEAGMSRSLHDMVADTREACPAIAEYYAPEELALYASALLQGRPPTNAIYMAKDFGRQLLANWDTFLKGVSRAATFLEEERVYDSARLPTDIVEPSWCSSMPVNGRRGRWLHGGPSAAAPS